MSYYRCSAVHMNYICFSSYKVWKVPSAYGRVLCVRLPATQATSDTARHGDSLQYSNTTAPPCGQRN
uniref:Uncharacterized protein n=1 Tax=Anguilla anguilla TaxID=7936 RepID=A0A0E9P9C9_ANGAN